METRFHAFRQLVTNLEESGMLSVPYREWFIIRLKLLIPFDGYCFTLVDPQTLLSTGAVTEDGVEDIHSLLFESEYLQDDFNKYEVLMKQKEPVATLGLATGGDLSRSARYTNVLLPAGFVDELRAVFVTGDTCWGYLTLFRRYGNPLFEETERAYVSSLVPSVSRFLRRSSLSLPEARTEEWKGKTGMMVLSGDLQLLSTNATAQIWMKQLRRLEQIGETILPRPVRAVCLRSLAEGTDWHAQDAEACISVPGYSYLSLRASRLTGTNQEIQLAVWFEPAKPAQILPLVMEAYALTVREKQIVELIRQGLSTKELAASLHISSYTVQDHLKAIFAKTGVSSRRELIGQLFSRYSV
jgi:DNA-binding CsgD family transcriptional regulator